jgi:hypothetical protein
MARALGKDYRPAGPEVLLAGWRAAMRYLPLAAAGPAGDSWHALLRASGRAPDWSPMASC